MSPVDPILALRFCVTVFIIWQVFNTIISVTGKQKTCFLDVLVASNTTLLLRFIALNNMTLCQVKVHKILFAGWCWANLLLFISGAHIGSPSKPDIAQHNGHRNLIDAQNVGNNGQPPTAFPLGECEGDCDNDDDCAGNLKCMQRSSNETVPGCDVKSPGDDGQDYCYNPDSPNNDDGDEDVKLPNSGTLGRVGNNGEPPSVFPLKRCHGDCDSDADCMGSLKCFQRSSGGRKPTGCKGQTDNSTDYCYDPDDDDDDVGNNSGVGRSFRLQMYWEAGFYWQEEKEKREWCMQCQDRDGNGECRRGDDIEIKRCDGDATYFKLRNRDGDEAQLQIAGTALCLEMVGEKTYMGGRHRAIEVRDCSLSNDDQYFKADWGDSKFAIHTNNNDGCLSQDHHPRDNEEIFSERCEQAADDNTLYWIMD